MKKIFGLIALAATLFVSTTQAQPYATPRFGTTSNSDQTYQNLNLKYIAVADAALLDTIKLPAINAFETHIFLTLTDTVVLVHTSVKSCHRGDHLYITVSNPSGANHFVYTLGYAGLATKWVPSSTGTTITLASAKGAELHYIFNGTAFVEAGRFLQ